MGIRGDFGALKKLRVAVKGIGSDESRAALSKALMHEALDLVDEGFATSTAPDGSPWKKPAFRAGQPLRDTRRLQSSFTGSSGARGFKIGTNVVYAVTHQEGRVIRAKGDGLLHFNAGGRHFAMKSVTIPKRQMVPEGRLTPRWSRALNSAASEFVAARMKR